MPGYQAPEATIAPAARVAVVFGQILAGAGGPGTDPGPAEGTTARPEDGSAGLTPVLGQQMAGLAAAIAPGVPAAVVARALIAWTQLFGMISFELFGQLVGSADPADEFFAYAVDQMATLVGLD